ncbi:DUF4271 domain-containing protein [Maribellus sediminis]|uniref:DUF4271 domain-containing protein n=1 Tax=Maribellus sediminis TaxID=2696285 RepID=UPI0014312268|nr:DUF4271 domain-containing protein [Maribellus sediminis]
MPDESMDARFTYQQDSTQAKSLLDQVPQKNSLTIELKPVSIMDLNEQPRQSVESTKTETPKYTVEQIRNWRLQQDHKLPTDSSKFISSRLDMQLLQTETIDNKLILPERSKPDTGTDWLTVLLFVGILLFATIRYSYIKYIKHLFTSLVNYPTAVRMWQESNYPASHAAYRLDVIFYLTLSIFVYQTLTYFEVSRASNKLSYFAIVISGVLIYFFGKKLLYKSLGLLFETKTETLEFIFNTDNTFRALGLVLLPLIALVSFSPAQSPLFLIVTGIIIVLAFYAIILQRGVLILLKKQFSIFYLFLYLCTLEFLPLLLIYKVVVVE